MVHYQIVIMSNMNETIFDKGYMIGVDRPDGKVENINLIDLMRELYFIKVDNPVEALMVKWNVVDSEVHISEVYDKYSGEVYWEDHESMWSNADETLVCSLLMWGGLEDTVEFSSYDANIFPLY